jgi:lipopolysaccharide export LptBFGC system permease protein LptF
LQGELHRFESRGETVARFAEGSFLVGVQPSQAHKNKFTYHEGQLSQAVLRERIAELERQGKKSEAGRLRLEMVRRLAVPLACLAFALLGVPLAVVARGARGSAYLITLGSFTGFYVLSRLAVALAENGVNAWLAGLLPDLVVAGVGLAYTGQLLRNGVGKAR